MTRTTNARLAGFTFLFYIAAGVTGIVLFGIATGGDETAAKLAAMAQHTTEVRLTVLLALLQGLSALVLGVTLCGLTRGQDPDLAMLGLTCRVVEEILQKVLCGSAAVQGIRPGVQGSSTLEPS